jgi:hypothetical protein
VPWSLRIEGNLDQPALEKSLQTIIERHEILRTTFSWKDGMPTQVVRSVSFSLPVVDLSALDRPYERAEELAREEARTPLDLERGPLVRAQLLRVGPEVHVLLLTMHHIIFDGWSRRILIQEVSALYEAYSAGRPSPLPPPKLQYADYAVWQRKHLQGATLEKQLSYWRKQLDGIPAALELPTDRPRPAVQTFNGARLPVEFSKEFTARLSAFSREQGGTLFMTMLAGFQILLARYSHQDDIVVGTPIANRNRAEIEDVIGFFANTLVLRTKLSGEKGFKDLLAQVKENSLEAYAHQDVPFEKLVEELRPERDLSQNPLFQVLFSLQSSPRQAFELSGLKIRLMDLGEATSKFDLAVFLEETPEGVRGRFEFNTDLFDSETIQRMMAHYRVLLESAITRPELNILELPLLTGNERTQILVDWNDTAVGYPADVCLHHLFALQAERTPEATAIIFGTDQISYRSLNQRANQLAHYLIARGAGPEILVGVHLERSIDMVVALLAVLKSGAAYVPLDPAYPSERIAAILEDARAPIVLTKQSLSQGLAPTQAKIVKLDFEAAAIAREPNKSPAVDVRPENLAYVLFTSGSTGRPKGVALEHRSATVFVHWAQDVFTAEEVSGTLFATSICFDLSVFEMFVPLCMGENSSSSRT